MSALFFVLLLAISFHVTDGTILDRHEIDHGNDHSHLLHWLETTDAELSFIGDSISGLKAPADILPRVAQATGFVTYCNVRTTDNKCGGTCTVYAGGPACVSAPHTACYHVSSNFQNTVSACGGPGCTGGCSGYSQCATRLSDGFCYAPGTQSILVTVQ
ncbi:uncharacterized protein SCHCODRAFT_01121410 [Schizophyllum commune H4-8]|nr:uncharacterized protein SCHCODRAFT_01121410 [Schizophyllum commune H4-8]KAI5895092.1 hypothetical protein SCHCODRAFT_01121410 [Schizophyllum commune H4-8]